MTALLKPGWSRPSTILFATEVPVNQRNFAFALAQAREFGAKLILFNAYDTLVVAASESSGIRYYDYVAVARAEVNHLEPLAKQAHEAGIECEIVVRPGLATDQILSLLREREVDRVVMGTHAPGPLGKLLVGSVAEAILRSARVPVCIIGPRTVDGAYRQFATQTILCAVSLTQASFVVVNFAAELAAEHSARLVLQHVIRPHENADRPASRSTEQIEADLLAMVPEKLRSSLTIHTVVVPGDPTEELLYQASAQQADLIVLGAHSASAFAAITRQGVVYKALAHAACPVMTLSPVVLTSCSAHSEQEQPDDVILAGVF
jgi:nucleotide-binding universal stress UspA family protein